ncbi:MAG: hypothetical protein ACK413_01540 [Patescibacteria group bacterium]
MNQEEKIKDYSYLKKDLTKVLILTGILIIIIIGLSILDRKTNCISKLADEIMNVLIKK